MRACKLEIIGLLLVATLPLFSFPLCWLPPSVAHHRFTVAMPIAEMVAAGVLLILGCRALGTAFSIPTGDGPEASGLRPRRNLNVAFGLWPPSILLVFSWLIAVSWSRRPYLSISILPTLLSQYAIFFLATQFAADAWRRLVWVWLVVAGLVALNGLVRLEMEPELLSTIGNRNFLAAYLAASVVLGSSLRHRGAAPICVLLLAALWFSHSRGAWLALGILGVLWLFWENSGKPPVRSVRRILGAATVIAALVAGSGYAVRQWRSEVRPIIWQSALDMIAERPFLGHGMGSFVAEYPRFRSPEYFLRKHATNVTDHAHNEFIETAVEQGLLGLVATLWLWGHAFFNGIRSLPPSGERRRLGLGILGATVVMFVHGMLDVGLRYPPNEPLFWFLLGLLAGSRRSTEDTAVPSHVSATHLGNPAGPVSRFTRTVLAVGWIAGSAWIGGTSVVQPFVAQVWERRARTAEDRGNLVEAAADAERSLEFQPFSPTVRYLLAGVLEKLRAPDQAIEQCLRIEEISPDYADVTYNLGQLYLTQGKAAAALQYLRRAVEINPYNADRHVALATAFAQLGQMKLARAQLEEALGLDPQHTAARRLQSDLGPETSP